MRGSARSAAADKCHDLNDVVFVECLRPMFAMRNEVLVEFGSTNRFLESEAFDQIAYGDSLWDIGRLSIDGDEHSRV